MPKLPGIRWEVQAASAIGVPGAMPTQDEPTDVADLSGYLEASD